jgi:hypothetical protein
MAAPRKLSVNPRPFQGGVVEQSSSINHFYSLSLDFVSFHPGLKPIFLRSPKGISFNLSWSSFLLKQ